jgi:hypothetical protein
MKTSLFESFAKMIDRVPDKEILKAIELEQGMLEDDFIYKSSLETPEVDSILSFCLFVNASMDGDSISPVELPSRHVEAYRKIVWRLVGAGEKPYGLKNEFDLTYNSGLSNAMADNPIISGKAGTTAKAAPLETGRRFGK